MFGRGVLILPSCAAAMSGPLALLAQNPSNAVEADEPMAAPDELVPIPNSCTAVGVIPADPLYLTLVDAAVLQPVIPVDHCERQTERARQVIDSFPDGT